MLAAGEVQRNLAPRVGCDNPAGEYTGALVRGLALQAQHAHAGVVVMQHFALRRLADQLIVRRFDQLGGVRDHFPLGGRRQRNAHQFFHPLQPVKRHAAAVLQLRDHGRRSFIVFLRPQALGLLGREDLPAGIAAQAL